MPSLEAMLERKAQGLSQSAIANALGTSVGVVAGKLWRHKNSAARAEHVTKKTVIQFPSAQVVKRPESQDSDMPQWIARRDSLLRQNDFIRVMHLNDVHLPFHDTAALSLWFEIAGRFNPHIVVVGSDMLDLPTISDFAPDKDISVDDWQEQSREFYWPMVNQLDKLLPNALLVWIYGNHERRALKAIKASDSPKIGMSYFIETVRCGGRVLHVGRTEHVEIGGLVIAHGNKAGKYAADKVGAYWLTKTVNFGHIHKHQSLGNGFSNGKLCLPPHYDSWAYPNTETSGTSTMTVDTLPFGGVSWSYHNFVQTEGAMWTQYGDGLIQVDDNKQAGQAAA